MRTIKSIAETPGKEAGNPESAVESAIKAAFWYGQHVGAKRTCDAYQKIRSAQHDRLKKCRYYRMAMAVLGNVVTIYDPSYGDAEIGSWDFSI